MKKTNHKKLDTIVIGELNIDLILWGMPFPEYEKEKLAEDMRFTMGSSSAITAHNLSIIGSKVGFIGKAGNDTFGNYMIENLRGSGVDTTGIIRDDSLKTGATIVLANPPEKALVTYMGAMAELSIDDIDWDYIKDARHLHLGSYYLHEKLIKDIPGLFAKAKESGLTTSLDTNWDPDEKWDKGIYKVFEYTDIFFPNMDEAILISHQKSLEDAVKSLSEKVKILIVKKGKGGASLYSGDKIIDDLGFTVKSVETSGAGDSFNAGFLHKFLQGADLEECMRFGNACGALAVSALGGTGAFQNPADVKKQLEKILEK
ncbi:carbohydrate kinase family protein [bacterium]|nr:carbohydrate kinase family protein [bacterium]